MRSAYRPKHASVSTSTRSIVGAGLTGLLLPLCLTTPAFADSAGSGRAATTMRISVPQGTVNAGPQRVGVRLLADGRGASASGVQVQRRSGGGWVNAGRLRTDRTGHAILWMRATATTSVRAVYGGSTRQTAGSTRTATVTVRRAPAAVKVSGGSSFRARALAVATQQAGKPYRWGAAGPSSFDCSGLVRYSFSKVGRSLPHSSSALRAMSRPVSKSQAQPGDLVFTPGHVGIYAGGGRMVDAPRAGKNVSVRKIYTSGYTVGRIV